MTDLVEVRKGGVYCDSFLVAKKFNKKHAEVVRIIKKLSSDIEKLRVTSNHPKILTEDREYRGQIYTSYLMPRRFFSLLVPKFKGLEALEWHMKFNDAFYEMETRLLQLETNQSDRQWIGQRGQSKIARREETDVIKAFVEYATKQGSGRAKFYYKHITNATYKALGILSQNNPKIRDTLGLYDLAELMLAERVAKESIKKYMDLGRNYKDIYTSVKEDLVVFASSLRINENRLLSEGK